MCITNATDPMKSSKKEVPAHVSTVCSENIGQGYAVTTKR